MQSAAEANPGTMAAVIGLELEGVAEACREVGGAWVANDNSPGQVVIAGTFQGVEDASAASLKGGAKRVIPLQVGGAFHTPLMQPAQAPLDAALAAAEFAPAACPVVANVDANAHTDGYRSLLSAQLCSQVRWRASLLALAGMGANLFVELGPAPSFQAWCAEPSPKPPASTWRAQRTFRPSFLQSTLDVNGARAPIRRRSRPSDAGRVTGGAEIVRGHPVGRKGQSPWTE